MALFNMPVVNDVDVVLLVLDLVARLPDNRRRPCWRRRGRSLCQQRNIEPPPSRRPPSRRTPSPRTSPPRRCPTRLLRSTSTPTPVSYTHLRAHETVLDL